MEENKKDVLPLEGEPLTAPQISEPVVNALAAALSKIETYVPTQYINDGPPDIDADHLNHAEQAIMRVTNLANGAADAIAALQSQVTQLNNNMEIETHNLVSLLNPDFYASNSDKWLKIYRVGNIKVIDFGFKTKALTGKDKIATDIPENLRPITTFYGGVQARDTGEWAKATYFPTVLIVTGNNLELSTGTNASRSMYVSGTVCYV